MAALMMVTILALLAAASKHGHAQPQQREGLPAANTKPAARLLDRKPSGPGGRPGLEAAAGDTRSAQGRSLGLAGGTGKMAGSAGGG
jgi:hypothetical protein